MTGKIKKIGSIFGKLALSGLLFVILNIVSFVAMFPFLNQASGSQSEMAQTGMINVVRIVFLYAFATMIVTFFTFWKKTFRLVAVGFIACWIMGTILVVIISKSGSYNQPSSSVTVSDNMIENRNGCNREKTIALAKSSTMLVERDDGGHGSAFSTAKGFAVTNKHVVEGAKKLYTWLNGERKELKLWNYSPTMDIAIIKLPNEGFTINWFDSSKLNLAEELYAVGWPNTAVGDSTITKGIYSRLNRYEGGLDFVQTDAAINPGNSGGPLINECGVVGINTLKEIWTDEQLPRPLEGLGNAISSQTIAPLVDKLIKEGSENTAIPGVAKTTTYTNSPNVPSNSPTLNLGEIQTYLNNLYGWRDSWLKHRDKYPSDDINKLLDSFDRQIIFCQTLVNRLGSGKNATQDDLIMWDAVVKMSYESGSIAQRLNNIY
ncbi:MAG: S1C family serine protease [Patescibacteria group bacterium]|nr:S1C family serine protease [Patescibacteria group bacterium]MCL5432235.1 S1C family serine protease [Patescibacteria group bacterium]